MDAEWCSSCLPSMSKSSSSTTDHTRCTLVRFLFVIAACSAWAWLCRNLFGFFIPAGDFFFVFFFCFFFSSFLVAALVLDAAMEGPVVNSVQIKIKKARTKQQKTRNYYLIRASEMLKEHPGAGGSHFHPRIGPNRSARTRFRQFFMILLQIRDDLTCPGIVLLQKPYK